MSIISPLSIVFRFVKTFIKLSTLFILEDYTYSEKEKTIMVINNLVIVSEYFKALLITEFMLQKIIIKIF